MSNLKKLRKPTNCRIDNFKNPHGWPIGMRVVKGGGCQSGDSRCICAEETGIDPDELWAVIDIYSIDDFSCGHTRPIVLCCGCKTREQAERGADRLLKNRD